MYNLFVKINKELLHTFVNMKALILNPPSFDNFQYIKEGRCESRKGGQLTPPVTLGIMSALLTKNKIKNDLYDFMAKPVPLNKFKRIVSQDYNTIFVSVSAPTWEFDKKVAEIIKKDNPKSLLCAFGVIAKALPEKVLEYFDIAITGEPEIITLEIAQNKPIKKIQGIAYREKNKTKFTKTRDLIKNLDSLPFPDRSKMPNHAYINPKTGKPFTAIKVQRGCPHGCSFCTAPFYYGNKARHRSPENIIEEIKECVNKYNITDFLFLSDTFTINHKWVIKLCNEIIKQNLKITWSCNSRIDTFNENIAQIMKKAGCWFISFGVESGNIKIIKENFKNLNPEKAIEVAKICKKVEITSMMYYILGFPNETKKEMEQTIKLSLKVNSDFARFFVATPLPGSKLFNIHPEVDFNHLDLSDENANLSNVKNKKLRKIIKKAYLRYYLRPSQIYRTLSSYSLKNASNFIKSASNYLSAYVFNR